MERLIIVSTIILFIVSCVGINKRAQRFEPVYPAKRRPYRVHEIKGETELDDTTRLTVGATEFHYTGKYCTECHEKTPVVGGKRYLKYDGDYNRLCRCHLKTPGSYIHPTDIEPSDEKKTRIPAGFPLEKGKVTCLTCHDIYRQCQKRTTDKTSLRGMPYQKITEFCFNCHNESTYVRLNAHEQLDQNGNVLTKKCLYCHEEKPDTKNANIADLKLIGNLEVLCQRCHFARGMRSGTFDHMTRPTSDILATMKKSEDKFGIILPLDSAGKVTCATCHNPHDRGVIPADRPGAKGAGSKYRLRLPDPVCVACHEIAEGMEKQ